MLSQRAFSLALALFAVTACGGGPAGTTARDLSGLLHSCPPFSGGIVDDPVVQPPNGAIGISPAIGSVTVPAVDGLAGLTLMLNGGQTFVVTGGTLTPSGPSTLTATIPPLATHTTYFLQATALLSPNGGPLGCPVNRTYVMGSFTTQ